MLARMGGWLLYFVIVAAILFVGWNEPLRYRFLSRAAIYAIEHPEPPPTPPPAPKPVTPVPGAWMTDPKRTTQLDGGPRDNMRSIYRAPQTPYPNTAR